MLRMAKDKFYFLLTIVSLITIYFSYIIFDYISFDDHGVAQIIETRSQGIENIQNPIDGLIIGGSNALWGISAKSLGNHTNTNFYNLTMHSNGVNYKNYFNYIEESISAEDASKVKYIFWSTIHSINPPPWNDFDRDIGGRLRPYKIIPNQSILQYIYRSFLQRDRIAFEVDSNTGDFIFDDFKCTLSDPRFLNQSDINRANSGSYQLVDLDSLSMQIKVYRNFISTYFPNAVTVFVVPSTMHNVFNSSDEVKDLKTLINSNNMKLHIQEPIDDISFFCEHDHHPNALGREIRTKDLANFLKTIL